MSRYFLTGAELRRRLRYIADQGRESNDKLREKMEGDPLYALAWGEGQLHSIALGQMAERALDSYPDDDDLLVDFARAQVDEEMDRIIKGSAFPSSSGTAHRFIAQMKLEASAEYVREVGTILRAIRPKAEVLPEGRTVNETARVAKDRIALLRNMGGKHLGKMAAHDLANSLSIDVSEIVNAAEREVKFARQQTEASQETS